MKLVEKNMSMKKWPPPKKVIFVNPTTGLSECTQYKTFLRVFKRQRLFDLKVSRLNGSGISATILFKKKRNTL